MKMKTKSSRQQTYMQNKSKKTQWDFKFTLTHVLWNTKCCPVLFSYFVHRTTMDSRRLYRFLGPSQGGADWLRRYGTVIHWAGKRGLRLDQTNAWLESITSGLTKPTVLVLNVGTNDIEGCSRRAMANAVNRLITSNTETTIIWSDILERVEYKCCTPEEQGKLDDRRKATNRYARALAGRNGGKAIPHPDIRHKDRALYRPDGLHLSNEGLDRFITDLKEGLSYLGSSK